MAHLIISINQRSTFQTRRSLLSWLKLPSLNTILSDVKTLQYYIVSSDLITDHRSFPPILGMSSLYITLLYAQNKRCMYMIPMWCLASVKLLTLIPTLSSDAWNTPPLLTDQFRSRLLDSCEVTTVLCITLIWINIPN